MSSLVEQRADLLRGEDDSEDAQEGGSGPISVMRVALALIRMPEGQPSVFVGHEARALSAPVEVAFREALAADPRVTEVLPATDRQDVDNARTHTYFEFKSDQPNLIDAVETYQAMRLNQSIWFRVRVPVKNQPLYRNVDDVPSDEYLVAWNGISLAVQWDQSERTATGSGGHIVLDILESAGESAGFPVVVLACSPGCKHRFFHFDVVSFEGDDQPDHYHVYGETHVGQAVCSPWGRGSTDVETLRMNFGSLVRLLEQYGATKILADHIAFLQGRARADATEILAIAYERAAARRFPRVSGAISDRWALLGSRRRTRQLIAGLWLALASVDSLTGSWKGFNAHLQELLKSPDVEELQAEFDPDSGVVESLDLSLVRESLLETASRLEGRSLVIATLAGACAALAGSGLTAVLV